jgi:hypothetical protein
MVSRENEVVLLFATVGLALAYGGAVTRPNDTVPIGRVIFVGVIVPQLLNNYLDNRDLN